VFESKDHTFVICAYKESPFLNDCIESLLKQNLKTNIIMTTSTPNSHIKKLAEHFNIRLFVNDISAGIASDWNFAYEHAGSKLVTLAHQDDVYCVDYAARALDAINHALSPLIFFSDYRELRSEESIDKNRVLSVKRLLLKPLKAERRQNSVFWRRRVLSLGSAICCPTVTCVRQALPSPLFNDCFKTNLDWEAWERVSKQEGTFIYCPDVLVYHRIHEGSTTSELIRDNTRNNEDLEMFRRFWPKPIAGFLNLFYSLAQKSNF